MKNIRFLSFCILLLVGFSATAQNNGVTVGFLINGVDLKPLPYQPTDPDDKNHVLRVKQEVAVVFRDNSTGASTNDIRYWDINGDMLWDTSSQAATQVSHIFTTSGFYPITLCVGYNTQCATRWVHVDGPEQPKKSKAKKKSKQAKPFDLDDGMEEPMVMSSPPPPPPPPPVEMELVVEAMEEAPQPVGSAAPSAPRSMEAPDIFLKTGRAGIPVSRYATASGCLVRSKSSFKATLQPKSAMDLVSFVVYATDCGGMSLTISGPEFTETAKIALSKGKNLIDLEAYDIRLRPGNKYTLTCTGITGVGGCASTKAPMFEDISKCTNLTSDNHPSLVLDQKPAPFIFDFKFLFQ